MLKKQYIKTRKVVKVTFEVPIAEIPEGIEVEAFHLVGEFNDWDPEATPMKRGKKDIFRAVIELEPDREYQFRYLANGEHWCNEWNADGYVPDDLGSDNCIVTTTNDIVVSEKR
jgi:1,4-alpha-glucan branching enzyme